jgi:hypothetical protein
MSLRELKSYSPKWCYDTCRCCHKHLWTILSIACGDSYALSPFCRSLFMKRTCQAIFAVTSVLRTPLLHIRMASTSARQQPPWAMPQNTNSLHPKLKIYNSLTRSKTPFVPIDREGKRITWYACGPTVYDDAHLGHARNYVTTDVIRRLLRDYFQFDLRFIMNITDVDDKVGPALRSWQTPG